MKVGLERGIKGLDRQDTITSVPTLTKLKRASPVRLTTSEDNEMKRILSAAFVFAFLLSMEASAQNNANSNANSAARATANSNRRRGPIFRANKDQINQAQAILKQRGFMTGDATGKLDTATRAALKKYQGAESLRVTGTLNRVTLEKMNITLTERQRAM